jgi:hypothetical protein
MNPRNSSGHYVFDPVGDRVLHVRSVLCHETSFRQAAHTYPDDYRGLLSSEYFPPPASSGGDSAPSNEDAPASGGALPTLIPDAPASGGASPSALSSSSSRQCRLWDPAPIPSRTPTRRCIARSALRSHTVSPVSPPPKKSVRFRPTQAELEHEAVAALIADDDCLMSVIAKFSGIHNITLADAHSIADVVELVRRFVVSFAPVRSASQVADGFTKPLERTDFERHIPRLMGGVTPRRGPMRDLRRESRMAARTVVR